MKKILYVWKDKYPWDVRVEKFCKTLVSAGYEVVLLARWKGEEKEEEIIDGFKVIRAGYKKNMSMYQPVSQNPYWKTKIKHVIDDFKPDLVIVREILLAEAVGKIARKRGLPVLMDMAENYPAAMKLWEKYYNNPFKRFLVHTLNIPERVEKNSVPLMSGIITVCPEQSERLNKLYNYDKNNTEVVYNTMSAGEGLPHKVFENDYVFGHHGYMSSDKNLIPFVKGFLLACEKSEKIKLFLAGEGENFETIRQLVHSSKYSERIRLFGAYEYSQMDKIMGMYSIGILPYEPNDFNNYTIHNKLFDYFAYGKPVFASKMKPVMTILDETNAGKYYDLSSIQKVSDAIMEFLDEDLAKFSENSYLASKKYNWDKDGRKLIDFIERYI